MNQELKIKTDRQLKQRSGFTYLEDPGHAWLIVTFNEIDFLGLADKISGYSYMSGNFIYLEEDLDAVLFFNAFKKRYGYFEYETNHVNEAHCRSAKSYDEKEARIMNANVVLA